MESKHMRKKNIPGSAEKDPQRPKRKLDMKILARVVRMLHGYYPVLLPVTVACIIFSAIVATLPAIFL